VVRATVEGSTVVVAPLREAATEVVAEATVAEQHAVFNSILLNPNGQAGPALRLAQFRLSPSPLAVFSLLSFPPRAPFVFEFDGNLGAWCYAFFWSHGSWCTAIPSLGAPRVPPGNVTLLNTAGVKAFLPGFHSLENRKDGRS